MKKRWLFLAVVVLLAACAPAAEPETPSDPSPARLSLAQEPQRVRFEAGPAPATLETLTLYGASLRVNDARCTPSGPDIVCRFGVEVPPGRAFGLPVGGTVTGAVAEYTRGGLEPYTARF